MVSDKIQVNLDFAQTMCPATGDLGNINYSKQRSFKAVGLRNAVSLDHYLRKVQHFIAIKSQETF